MRLKRVAAFLLVAAAGFLAGWLLYLAGTIVGRHAVAALAPLVGELGAGAVIAGIVGMVLAVVLAYAWARGG